jgi:hypothetical protein
VIENLVSIGCSFMTKWKCSTHTGIEVSKNLGLNHIDGWSRWGASNDEIVTKTKIFFLEDKSRIQDTFALIGITEPEREGQMSNHFRYWPECGEWEDEWFSEQGETKELKINAPDAAYWRDGWSKIESDNVDPTEWVIWNTSRNRRMLGDLALRMLRQILELQNFFQVMGIKYCMYHTIRGWPPYERLKLHKLKYLKDNVDTETFYKLCEFSHGDYIHFKNPKMTVSESDGHPSEEGHREWAILIADFIKRSKL